MTHELKTDPKPFQAVLDNLKTFEIRENDRDFHEGDTLILRETEFTGALMRTSIRPLTYTGREYRAIVTHVMHGPIHGLAEGWVIMSITCAMTQKRDVEHTRCGAHSSYGVTSRRCILRTGHDGDHEYIGLESEPNESGAEAAQLRTTLQLIADWCAAQARYALTKPKEKKAIGIVTRAGSEFVLAFTDPQEDKWVTSSAEKMFKEISVAYPNDIVEWNIQPDKA